MTIYVRQIYFLDITSLPPNYPLKSPNYLIAMLFSICYLISTQHFCGLRMLI